MNTARLNIVIPLSRISNLRPVLISIYEDKCFNPDLIRPIVVLDGNYVAPFVSPLIPYSEEPIYLYFKGENIAGHASRNCAIRSIFKTNERHPQQPRVEYFYSLDDDNILHPDFLSRFADWTEDNLKQMYIFSQLNKDGTLRLLADINSVKVGHIDTAMFVFDIKHAVDNNIYFDETDYCADGKFAETYRNSLKLDQIGVTQERLCYYNYLR